MREKTSYTCKRDLERRKHREVKRAPFIDCHLLLHALLHSKHVPLSPYYKIYKMENTREEEEEKLHNTTLNYKMKMKLLLKLCISPSLEPQGIFIAIREEGGQGTSPGPKRGRGHKVAARGAL